MSQLKQTRRNFLAPVGGAGAVIALSGAAGAKTSSRFTVANDQFMLDGKPFQILAGEMHYPRIPREYWRDRLRKLKSLGLNTLTTYVFWNAHETSPGVY